MAKTPIKFYFSTQKDYEIWDDFKTLAIINNQAPQDYLATILDKHLASSAAKRLKDTTWVSHKQLIERLESEFGITTNPQTLSNYRKSGYLDGLFGSDGGRLIVYDLNGVAAKYKEIQGTPVNAKSKLSRLDPDPDEVF